MATIITGCTPGRSLVVSSVARPAVSVADLLKRALQAWITGAAAIVFMGALLLAAVGVIGWTGLVMIYAGISVFTVALAALVYVAQGREES